MSSSSTGSGDSSRVHPRPEPGSRNGTPQKVAFPELAGFRLIQELGRSPKGVIYKARRLVEQDVVAVKLFRDPAAHEPGFRDRLQRNAEASFLLDHPGLVRCLGCVEDDGRLILVQEYAPGEPLSRALQRNVRFRPARALQHAVQVASALAYAFQKNRHHGRLHPGDVIVRDHEVRVLGMGLGERPEHAAWDVKDPHLFQPLIYAAPEALPSKAFPAEPLGRRAVDLYAVGALLYHMLTGAPPFRGGDEESIAQERAALAPASVRWPRGTERNLPARAIHLVQRLLAADPAERGDFDMLLATLDAALHEAEGRAAPAPVQALPPAEVPPRAAAAQPAPAPPTFGTLPGPVARPAAYPPLYGPERRREQNSSAMLIGAVVLVFGIAVGLALKTFFPGAPAAPQGPTAAPATQLVPPAPPYTVQVPPTAPAQVGADEAKAAKTLALIEEMLRSGDARYDTTTLRLVNDVVLRTEDTSVAGVRARLLKARIEEQIARGGPAPTQPAEARPPAAPDAEAQVFQEHLARAQAKAAEQRFGDAIALVEALPAALKMAPYPERAAEEAEKIRRQAKAAFADVLLGAEKAVEAGDFPKARGLFQGVQARFGIPELLDAAGQRLQKVIEAENAAHKEQAAKLAEEKLAQESRALAKALVDFVDKASRFRYVEAQEDLKKFAETAQNAKVRKLAEDYGRLIQDEAWLFNTCRQRLKDQIERDPKHSSPLQAYNKDKKPLFDIVDYNYRGITIRAVAGAGQGERLKPWEELDPRQPVVMIQLMMEKGSAQEQLAFAALNYHRALRSEILAQQAAPEENEELPQFEPQALLKIAKSLRDGTEAALTAAIQNDPAARERADAHRDLMKRILDLYQGAK
ncbi:MAG: protein kinase [Planctomycetota bacterium]|nr:protein kinase [Planctomycetota bacterium]